MVCVFYRAMIDIVFPKGNEEDLLVMAQRLGLSGLVFVYDKKDDFFKGKSSLKVINALRADGAKVRRARDSGVVSVSLDGSRESIEAGASVVFGFESVFERDHTHFRKSGLNQVLCKLAASKNVLVGVSFARLLESSGEARAVLFGRLLQNVSLCRKFGVGLCVVSGASVPFGLRSQSDLAAFASVLGSDNSSVGFRNS